LRGYLLAGVDEDRRKALIEALREVARLAGSVNRFVEEVKEEFLESVETAIGTPLRPEKRALLELYRFKRASHEDPGKLKRLIARYMGLEDGVNVLDYLRSLGSNSAGHHGEGGPGSIIDGSGARGREENGEMHSS